MPWCEECSRFWNPNSMAPDGSCPSCGAVIGDEPEDGGKVPWHFWVLITATGLYLLWRVIEGIGWLVT